MGNTRERVGIHHDRDGSQVLTLEDTRNTVHREYFYVRPEDVFAHELVLRGDESRHLARILRKKVGDLVFAVDGIGKTYEIRIRKIGQNEVAAEILQTKEMEGESRAELTLAYGMIKGNRSEWLVEKATELGVKTIVPVRTQNAKIQSLPANRLSRLQKIALSAMKQSGRSVLPVVGPVLALDQLLEGASQYDLRILAHPDSGNVAFDPNIVPETKTPRVLCLVGPEGGLESFEVRKAMDFGFQFLSFGARRLRSETAGMALVAWVLSQFEGWHPNTTVSTSDSC